MDSGSALVTRIDQNQFEFFEFAGKAVGRQVQVFDGYSVAALAPSPWANLIFNLDFASSGIPASLIAGIKSGALPNKVGLCPSSRPVNAGRLLLEAGFEKVDSARGMTLDLSRRRRGKTPPGLTYSFLEDGGEVEDFARITAINLFKGDEAAGRAFSSVLKAIASDRAFGVLASFQGTPVSTAYAFIDGQGVGGVYFVATEKEYRGRGFGGAAVDSVLDEAGRRGVANCILHATALGKPVYERLGFIDASELGRFALPLEGRVGTAGSRPVSP